MGAVANAKAEEEKEASAMTEQKGAYPALPMEKPSLLNTGTPHPMLVYAYEGEVDGLRTEIARLVVALERVAAIVPDCGDTNDLMRRVDIARAALGIPIEPTKAS